MSDGRVVIDVDLNDRNARQGVDQVNSSLGRIGGAAKAGAVTVGKLAAALGLVALAKKGIDLVAGSIGSAFKRIDVMEQFTSTMTVLTGSTKQTAAALETLRGIVTGTAYGLDIAAKATQNFVTRGIEVDKATKYVQAWGDAVAFYGAGSNEQLNTVMDALAKMSTSGKVGMDQLNRIFDVGIDAVGTYAKAVGRDSESVQSDLSDGVIKANDFIEVVSTAFLEGTNGVFKVAGAAKEAGASWGASMDNMKAAVTRGVVSIIQAIEDLLKANGLPSLRQMISMVGKSMEQMLNFVAKGINQVAQWLTLVDFTPLVNGFQTIKTAVSDFIAYLTQAYQGFVSGAQGSGGIMQAMGITPELIETAKGYIGTLVDVFKNVFDAVVAVVQWAFGFIMEYVPPIISAFIALIQNNLGQVTKFWQENGEQILKAVKNAWTGIKAIIDFVMPAIKLIVAVVWSAIKQTIQGALDTIMGLIKIFSGLFTGDFSKMWEGVKQLFKGAINLILGLMSLTFIGGIRTALVNLGKTAINLVKGMWDDIIKFFTNFSGNATSIVNKMATAVVNWFKNIFTNAVSIFQQLRSFQASIWNAIKEAIIGAVRLIFNQIKTNFNNILSVIKNIHLTIKGVFTTTWNGIINFLKGIDLVSIGKNIILGLLKGIGSATSLVTDKIKEIGNGIKTGFAKVMGIKSPARDMIPHGEDVVRGIIVGIDKQKGATKKSMEDLGKVITATQAANDKAYKTANEKTYQEILKIQKEAAAKQQEVRDKAAADVLKKQAATAKATTGKKKQTQDQKNAILAKGVADRADIQSKADKKVLEIQKKAQEDIAKLTEKGHKERAKIADAADKERLDAIKKFIDDKKTLEGISLADEAILWQSSLKYFKDGTQGKIDAQKAYQAAVRAVNDEIMKINEEFQGKMAEVNRKLMEDEQKLTDHYNKTVEDRTKALQNFVGLFDEVDLAMEESGHKLTENLQNQVTALATWSSTIEQLASRAIDGGLLQELREMGPKALPQLLALNNMTDSELTNYSNLYQQKAQLAREQAIRENEQLNQETQQKIGQLREIANTELSILETEWVAKISEVRKKTEEQLTLDDVGKNAIQGLMDGMASMEGALISKAQSIAASVKSALTSALDIHSPSRWMRDQVGAMMMKGWILGMDDEKSAVIAKADEAAEWMKPDISEIASVLVSKYKGITGAALTKAPTTSLGKAGGVYTDSTGSTGKVFAPQITNNFTPAESTPAENITKQRHMLERLGMDYNGGN